MTEVASVSLTRPLADFSDELGRSFTEYGFAIVRDHPIAPDLIARAWDLSRQFFALPEDVKRQYHLAGMGGARGYTPFGTERAKDAQINDLKEFWHVGRSLPPGDPLEEFMPPNVWPQEIEGFQQTFEELFLAFETTGRRILSAIALHLGLEEDFFDPTVENGNSVMRLLHYPPVPESADGAIRAAAHEDINTITLLLGAEESGLQLLSREGKWLSVAPPEGALAVNIGDMLQRLTNGVMRSTTHRVVNPVGEAARRSRYSMPFFLHFRPDFEIRALSQCVEEGREHEVEAPITAHDYLMQRLREINLV
ncbi:isopenicillin N synthase-like dioxygenase [Altererythrobacter atlanticus]|uniref:2-oxoglutarate-dependent ethylene/succinate-forming enzyme n=1 Tax=Croceibacterium atlanticum TaxID=1267766 RepID=A0A0F7KST0_9SPHN|nr:2-oxoglutarate and iron-dependent oxygenase domain-containing protein [Croceibacterium atlanticum]AKH41815.1 2-oxoglutarate-dependent ethylene/succinate-forming enzyme [Croceibacterium atlanticum]MBB5733281.1 isopenicillin N synthase-like dioxygenase [Croceibacterium atlanticum]